MTDTTKPTGVWLQDGSLIYRLEQTPYGLSNCDEIEILQVGGSRRREARADRAAEVIALLNSESPKAPGAAVTALAQEIVDALLKDETDGGYDLTAGMFGSAFSALVRRWAALQFSQQPEHAPRGEHSHIPLTEADKANGWAEVVLVAKQAEKGGV